MKKGERRRVQGKRSMRESLSLILNKVAEVIYVFGHNLLFLNPNWTIGDAFPNSICKSHVPRTHYKQKHIQKPPLDVEPSK